MSHSLLQINSSLFGDAGQSSQMADRFVAGWQARHLDGTVVRRDLTDESIPHLTGTRFQAFTTAPETRTEEQTRELVLSDALIEELVRADVIVLGLPMYNFNVPSQLKSYFDHVARAGLTFRYGDQGPIGLLTGKKAYVFVAAGGPYVGTPADLETPYVRAFLVFLGIADVEFIVAAGLAMGPDARKKSLDQANGQIDGMAA